MAVKQDRHIVKGMQKDLDVSKFSAEFVLDAQNIRITARDNETLLSVTNERGNKHVHFTYNGRIITLKGICLGYGVLNNYITVFTREDTIDKDHIYKIERNKYGLDYKELYGDKTNHTNLGFDLRHPIETLCIYENENIQKVYWVDGINQPRVINIVAGEDVRERYDSSFFDFIGTLKLDEKVFIERNLLAGGTFAPGVLQYSFTYFNKFGQETNIFHTSPLFYTSYNNRGAAADDKISNSFSIRIDDVDTKYDYIRIYSSLRTSINSEPTVKVVADVRPSTRKVAYVRGESSSVSFNPEARRVEDVYVYDNIAGDKISLYDYIFTIKDSGDERTTTYTIPGDSNKCILSSANNLAVRMEDDTTYEVVFKFIKSGVVDYRLVSSSIKSPDGNIYGGTIGYVDIPYISYIDTGREGFIIEPVSLLYRGGEAIACNTITQKDNTLFLGNINLKRENIPDSIKKYFRNQFVYFYDKKKVELPEAKGYYPYDNQLKLNSNQIKTFKYLEWYRMGVQFQHYTGKWSEPLWIKDVQNTTHIIGDFWGPHSGKSEIMYPVGHCDFSLSDIIDETTNETLGEALRKNGYVKVRPVVVYPTLNDRECICQGVLCPTVYNVGDRFSNSPFAQSSWFVRPNAPFDLEKTYNYNGKGSADCYLLGSGNLGEPAMVSRGGILSAGRYKVTYAFEGDQPKEFKFDSSNFGDWSEFRHNRPIPDNGKRNAEIQCISNPNEDPTIRIIASPEDYVNKNQENFYVDQSIVTLHSPDIEFDDSVRSLDSSNLKLRIVGMVPMTAFYGDVDIQTSTGTNPFIGTTQYPRGFYKENISATTDFRNAVGDKRGTQSNFGWRGLNASVLWYDELYKPDYPANETRHTTGFVVYPFHRNGSLNNQDAKDTTGYRSALLSKKKLSNIRFSYNSAYFNLYNIWKAYDTRTEDLAKTHTGISGVAIFDGENSPLVKLKSPKNSSLPEINYYGDVDKVVVGNYVPGKAPYPIRIGGTLEDTSKNIHDIFSAPEFITATQTSVTSSTEPVRIKYKSTPHAVIALNYTNTLEDNIKMQRVLPTIYDASGIYSPDQSWIVNNANTTIVLDKFFWDKNKDIDGVSQDVIKSIPNDTYTAQEFESISYGWLWLGELYNDEVKNRFGGTSEEALTNNSWVPCGEAIDLNKNDIVVDWTEGDTFYQRYDHIKTYPATLDEQNGITDIVSFMCETRVNIDGRYDRNRGNTNNFTVTPINFNLINDVYSQPNNFFNYKVLDADRFNNSKFPNSITWTKEKHPGEDIDTWTNITMANTLDLDGDKGEVTSLNTFNNEIFAFQQRGFSNILFNSRVQIPVSDGVPIEISNGYKVQGKRYISDDIGCSNKWSICESPLGIYFMDNESGNIYTYNGKLTPLSTTLGFKNWMEKNNRHEVWNPVDFNNFITFYDKSHGDVYFTDKKQCLCYSEQLGQFTSFMSYENTPAMFNIGNDFYAIKDNKIWENFKGDYNVFFCPYSDKDNWQNYYKPFSITFVSNPDEPYDKIFNTVEFRADSKDKDDNLLPHTFDTLETWNEYQRGKVELKNVFGYPSSLKQKYRIWRANIPRNAGTMDRMRNTWLKLKLSKDIPNKDRTILHDFIVNYFI